MRLICPNCSAQYEVPADVIPAEGEMCNVPTVRKHGFKPIPTRTTNRCCTNPKRAFRADRARGGTSRPTTDAASEPDPIDDEFERALDQELDTIAEMILKLRLHL